MIGCHACIAASRCALDTDGRPRADLESGRYVQTDYVPSWLGEHGYLGMICFDIHHIMTRYLDKSVGAPPSAGLTGIHGY